MKKLLLLATIVFFIYTPAHASLGHEKEYWIEEIGKTGYLNQDMISKQFKFSPESFTKNIFSGSQSDMESWRKTTLIIAQVIKNNLVSLKGINIYGFNHIEFNSFYINTFLDAIVYNKTIESFNCTRIPAEGALKVAEVIKRNKNIKIISCYDSNFNDEGALAIANALRTNNTLQKLSFENSEFSMSSRKWLRKAWSTNKVEGREQLEF